MSILKVDTINEKTSGNGVDIPGHVIQVQHKEIKDTTRTGSTTSTSFIATGEYVDIAPKKANSLIKVDLSIGMQYSSNTGSGILTNIYNGSSFLGTGSYPTYVRDLGSALYLPLSMTFTDTPNTTSTVRYEVYVKSTGGHTVFAIHEACYFSLIVTEIAQ